MKAKFNNFLHKKWVRLVICYFLGRLGVHRFLMKRWISGLIMLAFALLGATLVTSIWTCVDFVLIAIGRLTDKKEKQKHEGTAADLIIL